MDCKGVSASEQKVFTLKTKQPLLVFRCSSCTKAGGASSPFAQAVSELKDATRELTESSTKITQLHNDIIKMKSDIITMNSDITYMKSDIANIKEQIKPLPSKTEIAEIQKIVSNIPSVDNIDREIQERINRSCNLFIYNVPEPAGPDKDVCNLVKELLKDINNLSLDKLSAKRIPNNKSSSSAVHPILVCFSSKEEVLRVIRAKKKLPAYVKVSVDRTKLQRETFKSVLNSVNDHNKHNPNDKLFLKYVNGVPTAVPVEKNSVQHSKNK